MSEENARGRIVIDLFSTLDGVVQAPGGPEEDPSNGFRFGGWQAPFEDEAVGADIVAGLQSMDALLLGRRTYDIFAAYWPHHVDGPEGMIGRIINAVPKYVASRSEWEPEWENTTRIGADVPSEVDALRDRHRSIHVIGSVDLVQTLLASQVYDELKLWTYPLVLGQGKRVFPEGATPANVRLLAPATTSPLGVLTLRYGPVDLAPQTGTVGE
ncbi:dihydrofolate reductase family protein [Microbacterium sp. ZW T5_56]|uniref:dihydrofolate reductase family protein n=1 Tax=Microbacterium sp. ZW T5_56 TaxID=3378081 RepID=UPI003854A46A